MVEHAKVPAGATANPRLPSPTMTVVLVPGLLCDDVAWAPQIAALGDDGHDVLVVSSTGSASIGALATAALAAVPAGPFALAGHSLGARIALEMFRQAPGRVERIALLDTGVHPVGPGEAASRSALVRLANDKGMAALVDRWLLPMLHEAHRDDDAIVGPLVAMVERNTPASFAAQQQALLTRPDAAGVLPTVAVPTLVLVGDADAWSPVEQHRTIAVAVPGSELVVVEQCGHMSPVEQPAAVTEALRRWLAR